MSEPVFTILIVDDEQMILNSLSRLLKMHGYRVLTSLHPQEVLGILEKERVDILLSDIDMPKMTGTALMSQVRAQYPEVVRILMTGRGSMDFVIKAINEGEVYRYLLKPFDEKTLLQTLQEGTSRLKEIRRASAAAIIVARRDEICKALEREYPGLCDVQLVDSVYVIDAERVEAAMAQLSGSKLDSLLRRRL